MPNRPRGWASGLRRRGGLRPFLMRNTTMSAATTGAGSAGPHASRPPQPLPRTTGDPYDGPFGPCPCLERKALCAWSGGHGHGTRAPDHRKPQPRSRERATCTGRNQKPLPPATSVWQKHRMSGAVQDVWPGSARRWLKRAVPGDGALRPAACPPPPWSCCEAGWRGNSAGPRGRGCARR